jgi:hypothetical protein
MLLKTSETSCEVDTRWFVDLLQLWSRAEVEGMIGMNASLVGL